MRLVKIKFLESLTLAILALVSSAAYSNETSRSFHIFSEDLALCASDNLRACTEQGKASFSEDAKKGAIFDITEEALIRVNEFPWTEQLELKQQILTLLKQVKPKFDNNNVVLNERKLVRELRRLTFDFQGETLNGRDIWSTMFEFEKRNLFDLLEQKQTIGKTKRKINEVSVENTRQLASLQAFKNFFDSAQQIAGQTSKKRKPRVAFITGTNRDPYAEVDYYQQLFTELGFEATWLPIDAAMQTALAAKSYDSSACDKLEEFQIKRLASFRREILYPDLFKLQVSECKKTEPLINTVKRSDALFIADGSALLTYHALYTPSGKQSDTLSKILEMYHKQQIVIGVKGNTINAVTSIENQASIVAGEGIKLESPNSIRFLSGNEACSLGVDCNSLETERELVIVESGILPLLPFGVFDNQVSQKSRQLRALHSSQQVNSRFSFGLDSNTSAKVNVNLSDKGSTIEFEVNGLGGLWILDNESAPQQDFISQFTSHYLTHDDSAVVKESSVSMDFATWKRATQVSGSAPKVTSTQVLSRNNYLKLNNMLCVTGATNAHGTGQYDNVEFEVELKSKGASTTRKGAPRELNSNTTVCSFSGISNRIKINKTTSL